jgi:conjugative relaxase-like TrwC/TraI family protein
MTVSIRRMSLGTGYEYLLNSVARGDCPADASSPLTRYYTESGTPPGRWMGAGLAGLDDGAGIAEGSQVTEEQLFRLLGMLTDPVTGAPLGRRPTRWPTPLPQRIQARVAALPTGLAGADWARAVAGIEAEETAREATLIRPVAGFDLTFSVPKSVSTAWALADPGTQAAIYDAHREAVDLALGWAEQHVLFSRSGINGTITEDIRGVIAAGFDHWDSRAGDPHLHIHLVIANRVQPLDGRWRSLDSRTLYQYVVALSELHEGVLHDLLTARLGYDWDERPRAHRPVPRHEINGVADPLIEDFSTRSRDITTATAGLVTDFVHEHGRHPDSVEILRLRQRATLQTRPEKQRHTLADQMRTWKERARPFVGDDPVAWADSLRGRSVLPELHAADLHAATLADTAAAALAAVSTRRTTFSHANVLAEVHRQLHGARFATPADRFTIAECITDLALEQALLLTPSDQRRLLREDGRTHTTRRAAERYTTRQIFDAETRLVETARDRTGPAIVVGQPPPSRPGGHQLGADQAAAVIKIAGSGRVLDLLVGPAGTGKTAALAALRAAWEQAHGLGTVTGLAPSAAAAHVLADQLGIAADTTAKWIHEQANQPRRAEHINHLAARLAECSSPSTVLATRLRAQLDTAEAEHDRWTIQPEQLVIIDEATLAGTRSLDAVVAQARAAGGKVLLAGDWAQLGAIDAGGAFTMLVRDRPDPPELNQVRRFTHHWEAAASMQLRAGDPAAFAAYRDHDRIHAGDRDSLLDQLYTAWRDDIGHGRTSLMIAADRDAVTALNTRAHHERVLTGNVHGAAIQIGDGAVAGVGAHVVTRRNDRRLTTGRSWVKNGDTWTIHAVRPDGSLVVQRDHGKGKVGLPADYVREHVELGYATTAHQAQGRTVDTTHTLLSATATREALYVAATRGRTSNTIYLDTSHESDEPTSHERMSRRLPEDVFTGVLGRIGSDQSAHAAISNARSSQEREPVEPAPCDPEPISPSVFAHPAPDPASIVTQMTVM